MQKILNNKTFWCTEVSGAVSERREKVSRGILKFNGPLARRESLLVFFQIFARRRQRVRTPLYAN
jgi:hypothetical protein